MPNFKVYKNGRTLIESIKGSCTSEIGLLIAVELGDEYFGCIIVALDKSNPSVMTIHNKENYEESNPVLLAARHMADETRHRNGFYREEEREKDGVVILYDTPIL